LREQRLSDVGEFGLLREIARIAGGGSAIAGIGDDAAVLEIPAGHVLLSTVDMLVQGVHFRPSYMSPEEIGATALAVSLSDIAAMGGSPRYALVSLAVSGDMAPQVVTGLMSGLISLGKQFEVSLVGGNIASSDGPLTIDVTVLGSSPPEDVVMRTGARVGDVIAVTGELGARAGIQIANEAGLLPPPSYQVPVPRVEIGRELASRHLARAMIDLSDGLASDVKHVCDASGVGAVIFEASLPVAAEALSIASSLGLSPADLALEGGEDYELLVCLDPADFESARFVAGRVGLTEVGRILDARSGALLEDAGGERTTMSAEGWRHF
jgi:thiamine-monophosphate kinase